MRKSLTRGGKMEGTLRRLTAAICRVFRASPREEQPAEQSCASCCYFIDYRDTEDDPDEMNGYCCYDFVNGNTGNEYGGHWTHDQSWCRHYQSGKPHFGKAEGHD